MLACLQEMIEAEPKFFKSSFNMLFDLTKQIVFDSLKDQSLKELATEIIVTFVERIPSLIRSQEPKIKILLEMIVYHMVYNTIIFIDLS